MVFAEDGADDSSRAAVKAAFVELNCALVQFHGFGGLKIVTKDVRGVEELDLLGASGSVLKLGGSESLKNQEAAGLQGGEYIYVNRSAHLRSQVEEDAGSRVEHGYGPAP